MTAEGRPLPEGWAEATVGEVAVNHDGRRVPVKASDRQKVQGNYPYYGASGIIDQVNDYIFDGRYLLVAEDGANLLSRSTPIAFAAEGKFWVNNHAHVLEPLCDLDFLGAALNGIELSPYVTGSAQPKLTQKSLNGISVPLPPLAEQRRIVEKIEALTSRSRRAREALEALPALLDRYRASVLAAAFRGDLTKDWREECAAVGSLRTSLGLPAEEHSDPDARPVGIPASWEWARLEEIADVKGGLAKGKKRKQDTALVDVPYLRVANVQRGYLDLTEVKQIPATDDEIEALTLQPGDILFNEGGDRDKLGRGWVWEGQIDRCIHQNHVFRARLRGRNIKPYLVSMYANTFGQSYFFGAGTQSVNLASISLSKLRAFPVPLIPQDEQAVLLERVTKALAWADSLQARLADATQNVTTLDQSILAKAFRGELVPQDPADEPASALLERIRERRAAEGVGARRRGKGHG